MADFATGLWIEDAEGRKIGIPTINPTVLTVNRGTEPSFFEVTIPDLVQGVSLMDNFVNPCKIIIQTPDKYNNLKTLVLENWHIQSRTPSAPGLFKVVLADARILAQQRLLTAEYNVYISNTTGTDTPRRSSLNNGELWTAYEAAIDAIDKFGLTFEENSQYPSTLKEVDLPKNLGNHIAGGFRAATWDFSIPLLLEQINSDVVFLPNGNVTITDRSTRLSDTLDQYVGIDGVIGTRKQHWTHPQNIKVKFDTRVERWFYYVESNTFASGIDLSIENVIPSSALSPFGPTGGHRNLDEVLRGAGFNRATLQRNWLAPVLIKRDGDDLEIEDIRERAELDQFCRFGYRTLFRVIDEQEAGVTNVRMGHIGYDGDTISERSVYMPYERIELMTNAQSTDLGKLLLQNMSSGIPINLRVAAPWIPSVNYNANGEIIIRLEPETMPYMPTEHLPGRLENRAGQYESIKFGDQLDIANPNVSLPTGTQLRLSGNWELYIFYHGLLTVDRPDLGLERQTTVELPMFSDGPVESIEVKVSNISANYRCDLTNFELGDSPGKTGIPVRLINADALQERAELIRDQVKRNFEEGQAGIFYTAGIDAIVAGDHWVKGNINSLLIKFGADKPYSVKCQWTAMPEVRPINVNGTLDGTPTLTLG